MKLKTLLLLALACMLCTAGTFTCTASTDDTHHRSNQTAPVGLR